MLELGDYVYDEIEYTFTGELSSVYNGQKRPNILYFMEYPDIYDTSYEYKNGKCIFGNKYEFTVNKFVDSDISDVGTDIIDSYDCVLDSKPSFVCEISEKNKNEYYSFEFHESPLSIVENWTIEDVYSPDLTYEYDNDGYLTKVYTQKNKTEDNPQMEIEITITYK